MSMKRSRFDRSTSLVDLLILGTEAAPARWEAKRPKTGTCRETIYCVRRCNTGPGFEFLRVFSECSWCRKCIPPMTDVFMYGGCAFCTEDCREWQYENDTKEGRISPVMNVQEQMKTLMKNTVAP